MRGRRLRLAVALVATAFLVGACGSGAIEQDGSVPVPEVRELDGAAAAAALIEAGLEWEWVPSAVGDDDLSAWLVTDQDPAPGTLVEPFSTVTLTARPDGDPTPVPEPTLTATIQPVPTS